MVEDGKRYVCIDKRTDGNTFGRTERRQHIELIRQGATCFLIMCEAVSPHGEGPRVVRTYNDNELFLTGKLLHRPEAVYIEVTLRRVRI